jgi:hypothetical protein
MLRKESILSSEEAYFTIKFIVGEDALYLHSAQQMYTLIFYITCRDVGKETVYSLEQPT